MAIIEKRQLFRLNDDIQVSYLRLNDEDVNEAIRQLSETKNRKRLFPKLDEAQEAIQTNITVFGISFFSKTSMMENSHVSLTFKLSESKQPLYAVGQIAYCKFQPERNEYRLGVKFKFLTKPDMQRLEDYLVTKLQQGMTQYLPGNQLFDEEAWLVDRDTKNNR